MKRRICLFVLIAVIGFPPARAQRRVLTDSLYAPSIDRTEHLTVLLPTEYDSSRRYPVLYLLHGLEGNHTDWMTLTKLAEYSARYPMIIVMPDGEDSWYANALGTPRDRFEDYLSVDLQRYVRMKYPIDTLRQGIAGLSMGGYGALIQGLRHPERFIFAGSLSGSVNVPRDIEQRQKHSATLPTAWNLKRVFGDSLSSARTAYDLLILARRADPDALPYLYLAIGIQDPLPGFLAGHRDLVALLSKRGIAYEFHETPGAHTWTYWDREIQPLLARFAEVQQHGYRSLAKALEGLLDTGDSAAVFQTVHRLRANPAYALKEEELSSLGFRLLEVKKVRAAIQLFSFAVESFPGSSSAYEGLGEAYLLAGDEAQAAHCYRRSVRLNPANTNAHARLQKLEKNSVR